MLKKDKVIKERRQCGSQEIRNISFSNSHGFSWWQYKLRVRGEEKGHIYIFTNRRISSSRIAKVVPFARIHPQIDGKRWFFFFLSERWEPRAQRLFLPRFRRAINAFTQEIQYCDNSCSSLEARNSRPKSWVGELGCDGAVIKILCFTRISCLPNFSRPSFPAAPNFSANSANKNIKRAKTC